MRHTAMLGIALHVMTIHRVMRPLIVVAHLVVAHALVVAQALMVSLHVDGAKAALVHQSRSRLYRRSLAKDDGAALVTRRARSISGYAASIVNAAGDNGFDQIPRQSSGHLI